MPSSQPERSEQRQQRVRPGVQRFEGLIKQIGDWFDRLTGYKPKAATPNPPAPVYKPYDDAVDDWHSPPN